MEIGRVRWWGWKCGAVGYWRCWSSRWSTGIGPVVVLVCAEVRFEWCQVAGGCGGRLARLRRRFWPGVKRPVVLGVRDVSG